MIEATVRTKRTKNLGAKATRGVRRGGKEAANRAFSTSQEELFAAGDERGWDVFPVAQSASPPQWTGDAWEFVYTHRATMIFEKGSEDSAPYTIVPKNAEVLAFEWPEMAGQPFGDTGQTWDEVFEDSWPVVFLPKVSHPGLPAIGFVAKGFEDARAFLRSTGLSSHVDDEIR